MGLLNIDWGPLALYFIHDLSVAIYVGGAIAMEFVLAPAQQAIPPAQAQVMGEKTSDRFLILVWVSLLLIFVTGVWRLYFRGLLGGDGSFFVAPLNFDYSYGRSMFGMLVIWIILVINGALISFVLRPILKGKLGTGSSQSQANQNRDAKIKAATWIQHLTRIDLVLAVLAVLLGASLLRGGLL
jgi:uncharacterized membrane protein